MRNLLTLFCSVIVFCACASQTQSTQKADKDELNLAKLKAECEKNNAKSCYELGYFFAKESEKSDNDEKPFDTKMLNSAKNYLLKSCNLNYGDGCYFYAVASVFSGLNELDSAERITMLFKKLNEKLAYKKLNKYLPMWIKYNQKACDLDSANGCYWLATAYFNGEGVKKDKSLGFAFGKKACDLAPNKDKDLELGNVALGCMEIGTMYYNGENVAKNKEMALKYFLKGCDVSPRFACSNYIDYVEMFYEGYNGEFIKLPQDYEFAFQLAKKGCELKIGGKCNYLGILYQEGKGTAQNLTKAFLIFQNLCYSDSGYKQVGCYNLALCYANGKGVEQDYKRAFNSFKELCDKNEMSSACAITGEYYYNAKGIRQDYRKAMEYFGKACDMGEQSGCDNHKMMKSNPYAYGLKADDFK